MNINFFSREMCRMFQNTDFWIGLGIGVVAGVFGYKLMSEREQQLLAMQQPAAGAMTASVPLAELQRQKEELEDMIAAQETAQAK
jgi:hypothetical protein